MARVKECLHMEDGICSVLGVDCVCFGELHPEESCDDYVGYDTEDDDGLEEGDCDEGHKSDYELREEDNNL